MVRSYGRFRVFFIAAVLGIVWLGASRGASAQASGGTLERIRVHGPSLEGNLEGDDPSRDVFVYLPPSYARGRRQRYPVLYFLHGYTATAEAYVRLLALP
jgi:enterochelin esterase-like enzyme